MTEWEQQGDGLAGRAYGLSLAKHRSIRRGSQGRCPVGLPLIPSEHHLRPPYLELLSVVTW